MSAGLGPHRASRRRAVLDNRRYLSLPADGVAQPVFDDSPIGATRGGRYRWHCGRVRHTLAVPTESPPADWIVAMTVRRFLLCYLGTVAFIGVAGATGYQALLRQRAEMAAAIPVLVADASPDATARDVVPAAPAAAAAQ